MDIQHHPDSWVANTAKNHSYKKWARRSCPGTLADSHHFPLKKEPSLSPNEKNAKTFRDKPSIVVFTEKDSTNFNKADKGSNSDSHTEGDRDRYVIPCESSIDFLLAGVVKKMIR